MPGPGVKTYFALIIAAIEYLPNGKNVSASFQTSILRLTTPSCVSAVTVFAVRFKIFAEKMQLWSHTDLVVYVLPGSNFVMALSPYVLVV